MESVASERRPIVQILLKFFYKIFHKCTFSVNYFKKSPKLADLFCVGCDSLGNWLIKSFLKNVGNHTFWDDKIEQYYT